MRIVTRLLVPPPDEVRAARRFTHDTATAMGLDDRARTLAAHIVAATAYNPPFIEPPKAAALADRRTTIADGVRKTRPRLTGGRPFKARCPACGYLWAWGRASETTTLAKFSRHCEAGLRDIDQLLEDIKRWLSVIEACRVSRYAQQDDDITEKAVRPRGHHLIPLTSSRCDLVGPCFGLVRANFRGETQISPPAPTRYRA